MLCGLGTAIGTSSVFRSGITGPGLVAKADPVTTWNVHAWDVS